MPWALEGLLSIEGTEVGDANSCSGLSSFAKKVCIEFGGTGNFLGGLRDLVDPNACFSEGEIKAWFCG